MKTSTFVDKDTVVVFDIRNFSAHRYHLGLKANRGAKLLEQLIINLLESAVRLLGDTDRHLLNYTGDGFVLVIRGPENQLKTLQWINKFRDNASELIKEYEEELKKKFSTIKADLNSLDFGIGADTGIIRSFEFTGFRGRRERVFIGSAINVASRVEQCTKDYGYRVICTARLLDEVEESHRDIIKKKYAQSLGKQRLRGFPKPFELYSLKAGF
jgi:class 3 adenylate cyclase